MPTTLYLNDKWDEKLGEHGFFYSKPINVIAVSFETSESGKNYRVSFDPVTDKFSIQDLDSTNYVEVRMTK